MQNLTEQERSALAAATGWNKDELGTWYWPPSDRAQRDAVAATVTSWDLTALGVVP